MKTLLHNTVWKVSAVLILLTTFSASAQVNLASWTFDDLLPNPNTQTSVPANYGMQTGTAYMYLDGTNGSSSWNNNQRGSANGFALNDPRSPSIPSESYRINPNPNLGGNGKRIVWKFDMTGYENPVLTFALHGTPTSFSHQWAWSTNGTTFTDFGSNTQNLDGNVQLRTLDMTSINQIDNASTVYLRLTLDNAIDNTGRNRFDNMVIMASEQAPTFGTIVQEATACAGLPTTFNVTGLLPNSTSTMYYSINSVAVGSVSNVNSDGSGNGSFDIILSAANDGQTMEITSIERTDHPTSAVPVTTNNTVVCDVDASIAYYADTDSDGFGDKDNFVLSCTGMPAGHVLNDDDCDDGDADINPTATEIFYNGVDDNCDGIIDEGQQLTTVLKGNFCGATLAKIYSSIICHSPYPSVTTAYRFEVTNILTNQVQVIESPTNWFQLTDLADYQYGTTYAVRVEIQRLGVWLGYYGPVCSVTTPSLFSGPVAINVGYCGQTLPFRYSPITIGGPNFISSYHIRVTNITNPLHPLAVQTLTREVPWFSLKMLASYEYNTTYSIEVQVKTTGDYSAYTAPCLVTTPAPPAIAPDSAVITNAEAKAITYPNPYTDAFSIDLGREVPTIVQVHVYDMLGNLREAREVPGNNLSELELGRNFNSGVYNVVINDGNQIQTVRVIKR